jgi:IS30 family transposase
MKSGKRVSQIVLPLFCMKRIKYHQLTQEQRYQIQAYWTTGMSQSLIAENIGVHKSTISRELNRNIPKRGRGAKNYLACNAQKKTDQRHKVKRKRIVLSMEHIEQLMYYMREERYSPELVSAQWRKDGFIGVSHETLYKFIWNAKHSNKRSLKKYKTLYKLLKHGNRRRKRGNYKDSRGLIPNRVGIEKRSAIVEKRKRFGDFEVDLVMGANHQSALLVMTDRATLITCLEQLSGKNSTEIKNKIIKRMSKFSNIKTLTFDNDQAFSQHQEIGEKLSAKTYFTRPYTSQDKGTVENRNGVIRLFFPKKTDFNIISKKEIRDVENKINNRPVRKFGYLTPNEQFTKCA